MLKTLALYGLTALMELLGCFLPYVWLRQHGSVWLLPLAAVCLATFVYLLSLHPAASGRVYADLRSAGAICTVSPGDHGAARSASALTPWSPQSTSPTRC